MASTSRRFALIFVESDSFLVPYLETVPDIAGYAAANGLTGKSDEEIRDALGNKFPKHIYHSVVCIGALVAHKERDHWAVDAIGAPHVGERPEKELIASFGRRTQLSVLMASNFCVRRHGQ
jgi:3'-5' exonuclease